MKYHDLFMICNIPFEKGTVDMEDFLYGAVC